MGLTTRVGRAGSEKQVGVPETITLASMASPIPPPSDVPSSFPAAFILFFSAFSFLLLLLSTLFHPFEPFLRYPLFQYECVYSNGSILQFEKCL